MKRTPLDDYITAAVKQKRESIGMTQYELSFSLSRSKTFINHVESPKHAEKYNIYHLNKLAQIFNCSIADFFPTPYLEFDEALYNERINNGLK